MIQFTIWPIVLLSWMFKKWKITWFYALRDELFQSYIWHFCAWILSDTPVSAIMPLLYIGRNPEPVDLFTSICSTDFLSLFDLLERFSTRHTVDSHFQNIKRHSKQTGRGFHCLSNSDAMSYLLQPYCSLRRSSFLSFKTSRERCIWSETGVIYFWADYPVYCAVALL